MSNNDVHISEEEIRLLSLIYMLKTSEPLTPEEFLIRYKGTKKIFNDLVDENRGKIYSFD